MKNNMQNKNLSAFPLSVGVSEQKPYTGLTKREIFAMAAMQGLIGQQFKDDAHELEHAENLARKSIRCAD